MKVIDMSSILSGKRERIKNLLLRRVKNDIFHHNSNKKKTGQHLIKRVTKSKIIITCLTSAVCNNKQSNVASNTLTLVFRLFYNSIIGLKSRIINHSMDNLIQLICRRRIKSITDLPMMF